MRLSRIDQHSENISERRLKLSVHFDAFRAAPCRYLLTWWWRVRRKRVRARNQLAPLLGKSPRAYELWLLRDGAARFEDDGHGALLLRILALVDVRNGQSELDETLRSLSDEGVTALVIGGQDIPTLAEAIEHIDWSEDIWLMPIAAGDKIAPGAARAYSAALAGTPARIAYADDDLLDESGRCTAPHFKPDWNSELFDHFDYLSGACLVRASLSDLKAIADAEDWPYRLTERVLKGGTPLHVPRVLHHRHVRPRPKVPTRPVRSVGELPPITVIVPTRNRMDLLETCLTGVAATHYPDVEVIVVDNDSDDPATLAYLARLDPARHRVLRHGGSFNFSTINNRAAELANGRLLCLLNNDIEVIEPDWLATMAVQALRANVGAVGARLLYPDGRIQHAGVVIGMGGAAGHAHRFVDPDEEGYFHRHALPQFATAVTGACLVVSRERFMAVGGLDERNFAVAYNDVDLCMRLNQRGWQSFYEPRATLIHHESVSRGLDRDPVGAARLAGELAALKRLWGTETVVDSFHHPELSRASERFVMRLWDES